MQALDALPHLPAQGMSCARTSSSAASMVMASTLRRWVPGAGSECYLLQGAPTGGQRRDTGGAAHAGLCACDAALCSGCSWWMQPRQVCGRACRAQQGHSQQRITHGGRMRCQHLGRLHTAPASPEVAPEQPSTPRHRQRRVGTASMQARGSWRWLAAVRCSQPAPGCSAGRASFQLCASQARGCVDLRPQLIPHPRLHCPGAALEERPASGWQVVLQAQRPRPAGPARAPGCAGCA